MTIGWRQPDTDSLEVFGKQEPPVQAREKSNALSLTVVFTTVPETLTALRRAAILAHELGARIQIFVPYVVPHPLPLVTQNRNFGPSEIGVL